jgi:hypothetical protein
MLKSGPRSASMRADQRSPPRGMAAAFARVEAGSAEEKSADQKLSALAEGGINRRAA